MITRLIFFLLYFYPLPMLFSIGKEGVYWNELPSPPLLHIEGENIALEAGNSIRHSAKILFQVRAERENDNVALSVYQRVAWGKTHVELLLPLTAIKATAYQARQLHFFWKDPDGGLHPLELHP